MKVPAVAPLGYRNNRLTAELELDADQAPVIRRLFRLFATGRYTLRRLTEVAAELGLRYRNNPNPANRCTIYTMLQNPIYCGLVRWGGEVVEGKHEPIITRALFDRVKETIGRTNRPRNLKFAFGGLAICGGCGSTVTAERHRKSLKDGTRREYVYYHCTGWKNGGSICAYVREEHLVAQLAEPLKSLAIDKATFVALQKGLRARHEEDARTAKERRVTLSTEASRLKGRLDQAYNDKLDGLISADQYREKAAAWQNRIEKVREELRGLDAGGEAMIQEAMRLIDLARRAHTLFQQRPDNFEKRKVIDLLVSRVVIPGQKVLSNWREPFQSLSKLAKEAG